VKLRQVILNVLGNAIKFTPENGSISVLCTLHGDDGIEIFIRDSGVGIQIGRAHV